MMRWWIWYNLATGHHIYMYNFYTNPRLFADLAALKVGVCGIYRENQRGFPPSQGDIARNSPRGTMWWIRQDSVVFVKWMDTREVFHHSPCKFWWHSEEEGEKQGWSVAGGWHPLPYSNQGVQQVHGWGWLNWSTHPVLLGAQKKPVVPHHLPAPPWHCKQKCIRNAFGACSHREPVAAVPQGLNGGAGETTVWSWKSRCSCEKTNQPCACLHVL